MVIHLNRVTLLALVASTMVAAALAGVGRIGMVWIVAMAVVIMCGVVIPVLVPVPVPVRVRVRISISGSVPSALTWVGGIAVARVIAMAVITVCGSIAWAAWRIARARAGPGTRVAAASRASCALLVIPSTWGAAGVGATALMATLASTLIAGSATPLTIVACEGATGSAA